MGKTWGRKIPKYEKYFKILVEKKSVSAEQQVGGVFLYVLYNGNRHRWTIEAADV